jgi:TP901 family phage tail tape measure protein
VAEVKITIKADDKASGPLSRIAKLIRGDVSGSMKGLSKTVLGVAGGFIAAQASIAGVQAIMSKSIGAAMAYEAQMAQIRALTGATEQDTDLLTDSIMDMAREMPKSPAELGAGAYFILSSGIEDAADAADVLEVAARASTIGLGETEAVANALTTVLNAYGKEAGEAGHVTDVMIEAVKQGKAEASEFAGVLGRVVPLAAQMGISFEEVAANLATFTRLGVSADEAATGLRQVMASLLKPTRQQEEAMKELGFSAEGLRQQIKDQGLLATLDEMITATGGNEAAVASLFPNMRRAATRRPWLHCSQTSAH